MTKFILDLKDIPILFGKLPISRLHLLNQLSAFLLFPFQFQTNLPKQGLRFVKLPLKLMILSSHSLVLLLPVFQCFDEFPNLQLLF